MPRQRRSAVVDASKVPFSVRAAPAIAVRSGAVALGTSRGYLRFIAGFGLPLLGSMLWVVRHGAWIRPVPVALLGGLAAATLCSAGLSLFHHLDAALMVLLWQGGAVLLVIGLGGAIGHGGYLRVSGPSARRRPAARRRDPPSAPMAASVARP